MYADGHAKWHKMPASWTLPVASGGIISTAWSSASRCGDNGSHLAVRAVVPLDRRPGKLVTFSHNFTRTRGTTIRAARRENEVG